MLCAAGSALSEQQRRQSSAPAALEEYRIHTQHRRKSCNGLSLYGFCEAATAYTVRGTSPCNSAQGSERVSTRVVAELSTAVDSVHLSSWRAASALLSATIPTQAATVKCMLCSLKAMASTPLSTRSTCRSSSVSPKRFGLIRAAGPLKHSDSGVVAGGCWSVRADDAPIATRRERISACLTNRLSRFRTHSPVASSFRRFPPSTKQMQ